MPRWLTTLLILVLLFGFVLPYPAESGARLGHAINSMIVFLKSTANTLTSLTTGSSSGAAPAGTGSVTVYPIGGVGSGDGSTDDEDGGALLLDPESPPAPSAVPAPESQPGLSHSPPLQLRIPKIGVTSGFVAVGLDADGALEVPATADVVGWYRDAPTPGERGPAVVTAHVDWRRERGVFHDLGQLRPGDDVTVDRADGVGVTFRVGRVAEYPKARFPTDEVYGSTEGAELRMITCGGRFNGDTHSYDDNIVVYARMDGMAERAPTNIPAGPNMALGVAPAFAENDLIGA